MKRFYSLSVDRLEDRCVPAVDLLVQAITLGPMPVMDVTSTPMQVDPQILTVKDAASIPAPPASTDLPATIKPDGSSFVIDVYLIDPNTALPPKPLNLDQTLPIPDGTGQMTPQSLVPPINYPFWY